MSQKIVQINFRFTVPMGEYQSVCDQVASALSELRGLNWKAWVINEETREAGGIYLFDSGISATQYVNGPIVSALKDKPGIEGIQIRLFDIMEGPSRMTRFLSVPSSRVATEDRFSK